jgi:hypothetical protein
MTSYANEPSIMKYIKIAAALPDKTVRDVALRCRWLTVSSLSFNNFPVVRRLMIPMNDACDMCMNPIKSFEHVANRHSYLKVEYT